MKRECSIVRDVLPLYFENMVSEDTAVLYVKFFVFAETRPVLQFVLQ